MSEYDDNSNRGFSGAFVVLAGTAAALAVFGAATHFARAQAPLAHLGTNAIAVVEEVSTANAGVTFMDFIYAGQTLDLGADGTLVVSYLDGCRSETITGGKIRFEPGGAVSTGGKVMPTVSGNCQASSAQIAANATEAGAVAVRGTGTDLLEGEDEDRVIRSPSPAFRWLAGGAAEVKVFNIGRVPAELVWSGSGEAGHVEYPASAPRLAANVPYRVEVRSGGALIGVGRFSIDPSLELPDTLANRLVPVAKP